MHSSALSANVTLIRARAAARAQPKPQFGRKERKIAVAEARPTRVARAATIASAATLLWVAIILGFVIAFH